MILIIAVVVSSYSIIFILHARWQRTHKKKWRKKCFFSLLAIMSHDE